MPNITLTAEEHLLLTEVLESAVSDIRTEISETDRAEYKDMLKHRREVLAKILETMKK